MRAVFAWLGFSLLALSGIGACADEYAAQDRIEPPPPGTALDGGTAAEASAAPPEPILIDLGEITTGEDVSFDVPPGALGFNITVESKLADFDPESPFGIDRITAPNGTIVHDAFRPKGGGATATSVARFDAIASASVPQGEDVPENLSGRWTLRCGVLGSPSLSIKLRARIRVQATNDGAFHGGKLDLHVHVPRGLEIDGRTVDASKAATDPDVMKRIDTFFILTRELLRIEKGDVVFSEEASTFQKLDGLHEVLAGFAISEGEKPDAQALHVLLTNAITQDGEPFAAGIAPGIPGAANLFGRNVSGIIVTMSASPLGDAVTILHEAGHFFGLSHTTELDDQGADPLSDTPVCPGLSREHFLDCPDRTNIMFVAGAIEGPATLSPTQLRIYRGSPIYRATASAPDSTMSAAADQEPGRASPAAFAIELAAAARSLAVFFCPGSSSRTAARSNRPATSVK